MKIDGTFGIEERTNIKVVPNPAYAMAQYEEVIVDFDGREVQSLKPFTRYATIEDAQNKTNPIPSHIIQQC